LLGPSFPTRRASDLIVSFDDQVGAHGSAGGPQVYPFLITPPTLDVADARIENARDVHRVIMRRYMGTGA
jgi:hypothetical protein